MYDALVPGGVLIASEFTGPKRYAYTDAQVALINEGVNLLPRELLEPFAVSSLKSKLEADPSESISTDTIEPALRAVFDEVEAIPFGGNVLMRALTTRTIEAFDAANPEHTAGMAALIELDAAAYAAAPSDHTFFVARKR